MTAGAQVKDWWKGVMSLLLADKHEQDQFAFDCQILGQHAAMTFYSHFLSSSCLQ